MAFRILLLALLLASACGQDDDPGPSTPPPPTAPSLPAVDIRGADASYIPEIRQSGFKVKNANGQTEDMLATLKNAGVNTIRLRLWHTPAGGHSGMQEVEAFSKEIRDAGLKVWLTVHYSDSWADPGKQTKPDAWKNAGLEALKDSVYQYTKTAVGCIQPDYIQIGNEINSGLLWPEGRIQNAAQMRALLTEGIRAVREHDPGIRIMLHYAGHQQAAWFFDQVKTLDYDLIGLSYYPIWHGKDTTALKTNMTSLANTHNKKVVIAETAHPFTLGWNDYTNNIIGQNDQLLPRFPATAQGQQDFMLTMRGLGTPQYAGFCYWGGEWIAFKGATASDGSSWENQAFWGFDRTALPVLEAFRP